MQPENTRFPDVPWPDPSFEANRDGFPQEELDRYWGKYIAWSWDGTRIVAAADTEPDLLTRLKEEGIDFQRVVFDFVGVP